MTDQAMNPYERVRQILVERNAHHNWSIKVPYLECRLHCWTLDGEILIVQHWTKDNAVALFTDTSPNDFAALRRYFDRFHAANSTLRRLNQNAGTSQGPYSG